jgi:ribosome-associated protein
MHEDEETEGPSRTRLKREAEALQALGEELVRLPEAKFREIELPERLGEAVALARRLKKHGALRRQRQYIGRLMRELDPEPIRAALARVNQTDARATRIQHAAEAWRERLLAEGDDGLAAFIDTFPHSDRQHLRRLVRDAAIERERQRPPRAQRELFRLLRDLLEGAEDAELGPAEPQG